MRFFKRSLVGLFLLAVTFGLLALGGNTVYSALETRWSQESSPRPARERVFSVNVLTLEPGTITPVMTSFGEVASRRTLDVRAPVGGTVVELSDGFLEGAAVTKGQLLARIDPADAQTAVDVSQTDLTDGRLSDVAISEGGLVANNEKLAQLIDPDALQVSFRVSTAQYARLLDADGALVQAPITVTLDVFGTDLSFDGKLTRESAAVQAGTTGRLLFAELSQTRGLRPGDFVTVAINEPTLDRVALIPSAAVSASGAVLVLGDEDRLEEGEVRVLRRQGDDVIVRAGALRGREIVAERSQLLGAGIKVKPLRGEGVMPTEPETVELDDERRARLVAFVEANGRMPEAVKARLLTNLAKDKVPADMVARLESRMGS